ncbi:hypothetical protein GCM10023094_51040 [Rhodococcus olei]|uniref:Uncharacterized protein n=1 Tax=Rhodococcus olei TaxID=2161675 RepID=A0ABP8PQ21_9NOCA
MASSRSDGARESPWGPLASAPVATDRRTDAPLLGVLTSDTLGALNTFAGRSFSLDAFRANMFDRLTPPMRLLDAYDVETLSPGLASALALPGSCSRWGSNPDGAVAHPRVTACSAGSSIQFRAATRTVALNTSTASRGRLAINGSTISFSTRLTGNTAQ